MKTFSQFLAESQQEFVGIHYGKVGGLHQLVGGMYGSGIRGAESSRLSQSPDSRIKNRVYFYPKPSGGFPKPEIGLVNHAYEFHSGNLYDATTRNAHTDAIRHTQQQYMAKGHDQGNAFESAVIDHGFHGYVTSNMAVVLNHNPSVKYLGQVTNGFVQHNEPPKQKQSILFTKANNQGEHESEMLSPKHMQHFYQNKEEVLRAAPSARLQYGRMVVKTNDVVNLHDHFKQHGLQI